MTWLVDIGEVILWVFLLAMTYAFALISIGAWLFGAFDMVRMATGIRKSRRAYAGRFLAVLAVFGIAGFIASIFSKLLNGFFPPTGPL